jgi:3-methylcrotonyl-CoA carboxylase alpha subunit
VKVERTGDGVYRVEDEGRLHTVFVAGAAGSRWAFYDGRVYREESLTRPPEAHDRRSDLALPLTAPMPATVLKILVQPGAKVSRGETLLILEAMKMELPLRASTDGVVVAVHCREGELVQPETVLVELR